MKATLIAAAPAAPANGKALAAARSQTATPKREATSPVIAAVAGAVTPAALLCSRSAERSADSRPSSAREA